MTRRSAPMETLKNSARPTLKFGKSTAWSSLQLRFRLFSVCPYVDSIGGDGEHQHLINIRLILTRGSKKYHNNLMRSSGSVALSGAACPGRSGTPALTLPRISSMTTARAFRGFRFPAEVILWAVRWYLQFPISYRDLEAMLADRGVAVDHTTMYRWVQRFAPELEKRMRRHLRPCRGPWHVDETYIRVNGQWRYLYRAVDGTGQTIDFLLSAKRDKKAA